LGSKERASFIGVLGHRDLFLIVLQIPLADVVVYDDAAAVTTVVIKDIGNEGIDDEEGNSGDDELLQYGKARLKERNKKVVNSGQVLKRDIKKRLAHKANNKKGHNKKSKNSNSKQKSKKGR
jgi:hypothetical protein